MTAGEYLPPIEGTSYVRQMPDLRDRVGSVLAAHDGRHSLIETLIDDVLDALGLEQVGWWHDEYGFEVTKHGIAGPENSGDPVYRIGGAR